MRELRYAIGARAGEDDDDDDYDEPGPLPLPLPSNTPGITAGTGVITADLPTETAPSSIGPASPTALDTMTLQLNQDIKTVVKLVEDIANREASIEEVSKPSQRQCNVDKSNFSSQTETTIQVGWSGGGHIRPMSQPSMIQTLMATAAKFPNLVASSPQRTCAILMKYESLYSFMALKPPALGPMFYENAPICTNALLDAYMDYKNIYRNLGTDLSVIQAGTKVFKGWEDSVNKFADKTTLSAIDDELPFPATIKGIDLAQSYRLQGTSSCVFPGLLENPEDENVKPDEAAKAASYVDYQPNVGNLRTVTIEIHKGAVSAIALRYANGLTAMIGTPGASHIVFITLGAEENEKINVIVKHYHERVPTSELLPQGLRCIVTGRCGKFLPHEFSINIFPTTELIENKTTISIEMTTETVTKWLFVMSRYDSDPDTADFVWGDESSSYPR
ncbi:hypothetical protein FACUT_7702 [Fusarium acutatum]|uniref:Uncharacterized protein n=1 Tax=Fusarium acutatum TaxID=78861 RepID=A0A8H4JL78_9HYPO|nr:hypothetical protein FACUT_7702 [Fusarium acutatum]